MWAAKRTHSPLGDMLGSNLGLGVQSPPPVYRQRMPAPRRYVTEAIVLSRFDYGEADRILTLITPGGGKIKAIA